MNEERESIERSRTGSAATGLLTASIAAVIFVAVVACTGYSGHGGASPSRDGDAGAISVERPVVEICDRRLGDMRASLSIGGSPGDAATVEMFCGTRSIGACTATVPPGATSADCTVDRATPVNNNGRFRCVASIVAGRPLLVTHDCTPL